MSEKVTPVFMPPFNEQGVQQLTVKDATIFIGRDQPQRSTSSCSRCLTVLGLLFAFGIGSVILGPKLGRPTTVIVVGQPAGPCNYPSTIESTTAGSTTSQTTSPINWVSNSTVIYSLMNPAAPMLSYMQIATLYTAQAYQTTLSFALRNGPGHTYLDDVSIIDPTGKELLINGNFENGTFGWTGAFIHSLNAYLHNGSSCHGADYSSEATVSQTFWTTPGTVLNISFLLQWNNYGSGITHRVTVSP